MHHRSFISLQLIQPFLLQYFLWFSLHIIHRMLWMFMYLYQIIWTISNLSLGHMSKYVSNPLCLILVLFQDIFHKTTLLWFHFLYYHRILKLIQQWVLLHLPFLLSFWHQTYEQTLCHLQLLCHHHQVWFTFHRLLKHRSFYL